MAAVFVSHAPQAAPGFPAAPVVAWDLLGKLWGECQKVQAPGEEVMMNRPGLWGLRAGITPPGSSSSRRPADPPASLALVLARRVAQEAYRQHSPVDSCGPETAVLVRLLSAVTRILLAAGLAKDL